MHQARVKSLIEMGRYRPRPSLIAEAMLRRPGVRELLAEEERALNQVGRTRLPGASGPRAA